MKKFILVCIFSFLAISTISFSQVKFHAEVSDNTVQLGERIQVSFVLENARGTKFIPPDFKGFSVLSGPNQSQSTQLINGKVSSSITYSYILSADMSGKFAIQPASITAEGKRLETQAITITVVKGNNNPKEKNQGEVNLNRQAENVVHKNLFLKLFVNKSQAYEGEPIVATYKLYVHPQLQLLNLGQTTMPTFNGFWTQDLGIKKLQFRTESLNGVTYRVAELKKVVLLAQQSGNLEIEPMKIESVVRLQIQGQRRSSRSLFDNPLFDSFFNTNYRDFRFTITSGKSKIHIKPLPGAAPPNFAGAVGNFKLVTTIDKRKAKTGDAITLKVKISGNGNLKLIDALPLDLPPDIDMFDPKISENINVSASGMTGSKTFEYYLIPRNPGQYKIKPVVFTYFDLNERKYKTLTSEEFVLDIEQGSGNPSTVVSGVNKKDVKYLGKDIRFIKTNLGSIETVNSRFAWSFLFFGLIILPFIIFFIIFIYAKRREEMKKDIMLMRNRKASSLAKKRLSAAKSYLDKNVEDNFYEEISKVLTGYVADKLSIPTASFTREEAKLKLIEKNVDGETIENFLNTIDYCDSVRYAPQQERLSMQEVYNKASMILTKLEGLLR